MAARVQSRSSRIRHVKKGDTVAVITGNDKGTQGEVLLVDHARSRVLVQGVNQGIVYIRRIAHVFAVRRPHPEVERRQFLGQRVAPFIRVVDFRGKQKRHGRGIPFRSR